MCLDLLPPILPIRSTSRESIIGGLRHGQIVTSAKEHQKLYHTKYSMPCQIFWSEALESLGGHQGILGNCLQMIDQTKSAPLPSRAMPNKRLLLTAPAPRASSLSFSASACILVRSRIAHRYGAGFRSDPTLNPQEESLDPSPKGGSFDERKNRNGSKPERLS